MQNPSTARRPAAWLLVLATALTGLTWTGVSLAASAPSQKGQQTTAATPRHLPSKRPAAHPIATTAKAKPPSAQPKTHRKTPVNTRLAAKSKTAKRAHPTATKPAKSLANNPKHAA